MNKKIIILAIFAVLVVTIYSVFIKSTELKLNLDTTNIHSIEYDTFDGIEMKHKKITNKGDISKITEYINSLSLTKTSLRPKDATNSLSFKDENNKVFKSFKFGDSGVLWLGSKTYTLGSSNMNTLKNMLINIDK
ncbi:MAG: hypothetical protein E7212_02620 [Clostridium sartagoforme]|nr:hypothetical protein [Clostridium sartagoforme]